MKIAMAMRIIRNPFALIFVSVMVLLMVGLTALDSFATGREPKRVFILNSYHQGNTWSDNTIRGIDDAFGKSGIKVETYVTHMDAKRIPPSPQHFSNLKKLIKEGYKGIHFDVILASDNDALEFMRKYRDELFPGVPVVFSGINDFDERMLDKRRDITGTIERNDYAGTISLALKLRPAARNIVVITDNTTTGRAHRSAVEKIRPDFPQGLAFTYLSLGDMTLDELAQTLSKLNSDSIVLLLHHFVDKNGTSHTVKESALFLVQSSPVPGFVVGDNRMGSGVLGGHMVTAYSQGEAAARMAMKILSGTDIGSIPVLLNSPNKFMFDYRAMQRFGIAEKNLPQGSILINKPVSALDEYRPQLLAILGAFIVLCGILVYLLLEIRRRKRVEDELRASQQIIKGIIDAIPVRVFWKDKNLIFLGCNTVFARDAGFDDPKDIIGKDDYQMVWRDHAELYRSDDLQVIESGCSKLFIEEPQTTPEGNIIMLLTSKIPLRSSDGEIIGVLGTYMDITDRKQAEDQIKASLKEKEVLLREVHHRVKNNMQVVSSLLNMQSRNLTDTKAIDIFRASINRIRSMALIHDKLYQTEGLSRIDVRDYIRDLSRGLLRAYSIGPNINLDINVDPLFLDIDTVMPLGILINELVTNSLKHAFPGDRPGRIGVSLKNGDGQRLVLTVSDNGIGIPADLDHTDTESMGMQLVVTLVEQLEGTMELVRGNGTEFRITFREEQIR